MPLLELKDVSFKYVNRNKDDSLDSSEAQDSTFALKDVSLSVESGEFVGIIGPSGSGKTTLASLFSGAIPHHYSGELLGSVKIAGQDTNNLALTNIACLVGSVIQDIDAQMVAANVEDEILFGLENFGVAHSEIPSRIDEALQIVGISDLRNRDLDTLSGGQKQKVAIAAILALKPKVMVLDEPTCALDPVSSKMIFSILKDLNKNFGITVVVIEQKVALLSEYCKRLVVLSNGILSLDLPVSQALKNMDLLYSIGINYPRTTHLVNDLQRENICSKSDLPVSVEDTVNTIVNTINSEKSLTSHVDSHSEFDNRECDSNKSALACDFSHESQVSTQSYAQNKSKNDSPCLSLKNVSFLYQSGVSALKNVSFEAYAGELVTLVGRNGAGKTTITKIINGLLKPTEGNVTIDGVDTKSLRISQIAKYVSTLFQNPDRQLCKETVLEEVTLSCILIGQNEDEAKAHAMEIIDELELDSEASPFMLSRGQRQMVALAATVVTNPKILLLDEPTCGLDYKECMRIMQVVERLRKNGCCVIMVCHDMEVVLDYATRLITINDGKLIIDGSAYDVFEKPEVCSAAALYPPLLCSVSQGLVAHGFNKCNGLYVREELVEALRGEKITKQTVQNQQN
ncbi:MULTISPECIES: ABC transporter ATP-binding protein [Gardnerella]|uniref:ABC transporter ATP-binding protein n=1 Tax=Gardnerella TaxID=2701 RepID=UPI000C9EE3A3|nr:MULTISPECIES: ABC transporter ATP-binding protein [Gardnerella]NSX40046.1 energy-coupling factor ABC transporter ATP-binding protein [Gardnerella vaginalis]RFT35016.1 ABC transporter ATP-binding protein [Bifidobacteriaceae bacterium NR020]RIY29797.1 ABC transporter ATP-binding protein [Bifidobacteriaceae bacterium NR016]MDK6295171.1 energy-coupling factor transporter ATPase [Gardnerella swidsinskii]MDK7093316.1 energy-coupling factor transporter ATPase [Gardnerella swidsinskii]